MLRKGRNHMTFEERKQLLSRLIELGLWAPSNDGDPTIDEEAARRLRDQMEEYLIPECAVLVSGLLPNSPTRHMQICRGEFEYSFPTGDNLAEAICLAAVVFPAFLDEHPELVARPGGLPDREPETT